jgi:hypothetical protein
MDCINCNKKIKKCNNCNNYVKKCNNCWYDFDKKYVDRLPYISYYTPLSKKEQDEYLRKQLETIACGKCDYTTNLYLKYGNDIPIISLLYEDIKIEIKFDKN